MQSNHLDVYKILGEDKGNEQIYKDIGSFIFKETSKMINDPTCLILKLKGLGSWHLRKKRMEIVVNEWTDRSAIQTRDMFPSDDSYNTYLEKHNRYINFQERLKEYDKYLDIKKEIRKERYKTQVLLTPTNTEEKFKSE